MRTSFITSRSVRKLLYALLGLLCLTALAPCAPGLSMHAAAPTVARAASATLAVSPSVVTPGGTTLVSGAGFAPGERIDILLNGVLQGVLTADANGAFGTSLLRIGANAAPGLYTVQANGETSKLTASVVLTVQASTPPVAATITVSPSSVSAGGQIVAGGSGFAPGESVLITFNGALQPAVTADATGAFSGVLISVPAGTANGSYQLTAAGATSNRQASTTITVQAAQPVTTAGIVLSPTTASPGTTVQVAGTGFAPGESILLTLNSAVVSNFPADASGAFVRASFVVPADLALGHATVAAFGATSQRLASAALTVVAPPAVIVAHGYVNPASTVPGAQVQLGGSGFQPSETVLVRLDGTIVANFNADATGTFKGTYTVQASFGTHTITMQGAVSLRVASAALVVIHPVVVGIGVHPNRTHRGSVVHVNGINFLPGETVLIWFRGTVVQRAIANSQGDFFGANFTVPGNAPYGASIVRILGARTGRSAQAVVVVLPAPAPAVSIHLSSSDLHHGSRVTVSGRGFQGAEIVVITFRGNFVLAVRADRGGAFAGAVFHIGVNVPFGTYSLRATGASSGRSVTTHVRVTPIVGATISISPTVAHRGQVVTVRGSGYQAGEFVLIRLRGTIVQAVTADTHGSYKTSFRVAANEPRGITTVQAMGARSNRHAQQTIAIV